mmetsp:Transcript_42947/g.90206  ORF Transcript_42947/g.90206 Transcript_42947/m.90206 type:complete len:423 (+) Transcript_42947:74-1342(+)
MPLSPHRTMVVLLARFIFAALLLPLTLHNNGVDAFSASSSSSSSRTPPFTTAALHATTTPSHQGGSLRTLPDIDAAVIVPGFLTGKSEFLPLAQSLTNMGIPTVVVPMPNWHWLPCLGGRSMRPMLERIDFTVRHLAGVAGDLGEFEMTTAKSLEQELEDSLTKQSQSAPKMKQPKDPQLYIPNFSYNIIDCYQDFRNNPGGVLEVGGSAEVDDYPLWTPRGSSFFANANNDPSSAYPEPTGRVALVGHSAGGWICRAYLSDRNYGGKAYNGRELVHSLVTLGSPHGNAPGAAFKGVEWVNRRVLENADGSAHPIRALAVGGTGYRGDSSGQLTQNAYAFCCAEGSDGRSYDGDGVTPIQSALAMTEYVRNGDSLVLDDVGHFCWSDVFGGEAVAPDLTKYHKEGRPWYGDEHIIEKWVSWL